MALSNYYFSHSHPEAFKSVGKCITRIYILLCDIDIVRTYCVHFSHQNSFLLFVAISNTFLLFAMHQQCWYTASSQFSFKHVRAEKKYIFMNASNMININNVWKIMQSRKSVNIQTKCEHTYFHRIIMESTCEFRMSYICRFIFMITPKNKKK